MELQVLNVGLAAASAAKTAGLEFEITSFALGDAYNYTPAATDTGLHGNQLFKTGVQMVTNVDEYTKEFLCICNEEYGDFYFGEIVLFDSNGVAFALGSWAALQEKQKYVASARAGNVVAVKARVTFSGVTSADITYTLLEVSLATLLQATSVDLLQPPVTADSNAYLTSTADPKGGAILAYRQADWHWSFPTYAQITTGTVSTATVTSLVTSTDITDLDNYSYEDGLFILQFTSGQLKGFCRRITGITTSASFLQWATAFGSAAAAGDTFEVLMYGGSGGSGTIYYADIAEYNVLAGLLNSVISTPNTTTTWAGGMGWNWQTVSTISGRHVRAAEWESLSALKNTVNSYLSLTYGSNTPLDDFIYKSAYNASLHQIEVSYAAFASDFTNLVTHRHDTVPSANMEYQVTSLSYTRTFNAAVAMNSWSTLGGDTYAELMGYLNTGCTVAISLSMDIGTSTNTYLAGWKTFMANFGTITFWPTGTVWTPSDSTGITTTVNTQTLYTAIANKATYNLFTANKTIDNVPASLFFQIGYSTTHLGSISIDVACQYGALPQYFTLPTDSVTVTVNITAYRPSSSIISNPVIAYPAITAV